MTRPEPPPQATTEHDAPIVKNAGYYAEVRKAIGRGAPTLLLGASTRSLERNFERLETAHRGIAAPQDELSSEGSAPSRRQRWRRFVSRSPILATVLVTFAGAVIGAVVQLATARAVHNATKPPSIGVLINVMNAEAAATRSGDLAALASLYAPGAVVTDAGCQTRGTARIWAGLNQITARYDRLPRFLSLRHVDPQVVWLPDNSTAAKAEVTAETVGVIAPPAKSPNPVPVFGHELWTFALSQGRWVVTSFTYNLC